MLQNALVVWLALSASPAAIAPSPDPSTSRVRPQSGQSRALLADAVDRSVTVARLVATLQRHRVFVFVDLRVDPAVPTGETALLTANEVGRYVQIVLNATLRMDRRIEVLGHELQHALEIAVADDIANGASLRRHFAAIGRTLSVSTRVDQAYETDAAQAVEQQVRRDLTRGARAAGPERVAL